MSNCEEPFLKTNNFHICKSHIHDNWVDLYIFKILKPWPIFENQKN
jgi:hypothetical protein